MGRARVARRLDGYNSSVFEEVAALARRCGAVNLGAGIPDLPVPESLKAAVSEAVAEGHNQYSPVCGEALLREAVAAHALRFYGQNVDPASEVAITSGVTEGVHAALMTLVDPGDEVIVFEPFYDSYVPAIRMAGAVPVALTLREPTFRFNHDDLRAAFSPRTRALLLNTPHNPTGIVYSSDELAVIAGLCQKHDVVAITDEVYEHVVFDGSKHLRLATLPGMWERTLTLSGASKTFSCTGWRIGWAIGPAELVEALCRLRQFTVFASATPLQLAVAVGLRFPDAYFHGLADDYQGRRDVLVDALDRCGLRPHCPEGGFFILTEVPFEFADGRRFCQDLAERIRVAAIPLDTFYLDPHRTRSMARFTFAVGRELLDLAARRLESLRQECPHLGCHP